MQIARWRWILHNILLSRTNIELVVWLSSGQFEPKNSKNIWKNGTCEPKRTHTHAHNFVNGIKQSDNETIIQLFNGKLFGLWNRLETHFD